MGNSTWSRLCQGGARHHADSRACTTAELLHGIPWYPGDIDKELVTPTGAALVAELCSGFGDRPTGFLAEKNGLRRRNLGSGDSQRDAAESGQLVRTETSDEIWLLEANVDDSTPEVIAYAIDKLLAAGADRCLDHADHHEERPTGFCYQHCVWKQIK